MQIISRCFLQTFYKLSKYSPLLSSHECFPHTPLNYLEWSVFYRDVNGNTKYGTVKSTSPMTDVNMSNDLSRP
jgi:hypothetical protein